MFRFFKIFIIPALLYVPGTLVYAQLKPSLKTNFIFSAIKGSSSKTDSLTLPVTAASVHLTAGDTAMFIIVTYKKNKLAITFAPAENFIGIAKATMQVKNRSGQVIEILHLTGLSTKGLEGENEAPLKTITEALGYTTSVGWTTLANHARPELQGDEISFSLFRKSTKGNVEIIPVARYSPDFELSFGYYIDSAAIPVKHDIGTLAKRSVYPEHQTLFPALANGSTSFDPGNNTFGFYATSPTHTVYTEDVWNMLFHPANAVRGARIYPLKNNAGKIITDSYLLCYEEAKNGDYNDYVFIVKNIKPVTTNLFKPLFNGKNLDGFHTYLNKIGMNKDPNNNFLIEDSVLHVVGQDLGYAITDKSFSNYHLKVEFKWGERKWGSRTKEKRDAGICYNIPLDEPDSIWPQSIECQIQEGDVGDFWLLGFSTIKVNGIQNVPANHTRMMKQQDGEKITGDWNTVEVISYNGKCVHIVNGIVVNAGEDASVKEGRILLQSEYAEVYYRNVKIRKL